MSYSIELLRDWRCAHRGAPEVTYKAGVYAVPKQLSYELARRARDARVAVNVEQDEPAPLEPVKRKSKGRAPENKSLA